jgi:H+/Cl- antiporter ClcA
MERALEIIGNLIIYAMIGVLSVFTTGVLLLFVVTLIIKIATNLLGALLFVMIFLVVAAIGYGVSKLFGLFEAYAVRKQLEEYRAYDSER